MLLAVELYWRLTSPARRRTCLFRESCSHHVYRVTQESGAFKGLMAFTRRLRRCRFGYAVEFDEQAEPFLRLADGSVTRVAELAGSMVALLEQSKLAVHASRITHNRPYGMS